ncbi:protein of unknown function [Xenorhabdus doucetiae]|uniref:Uncharacterized protein n=1 Tax=Xenorhabdus doucetiae TaxID=351671 RepID=A0A068QWH5_9GAMM|nr:protein of unknown function [Xenorhabdus doucetiae]
MKFTTYLYRHTAHHGIDKYKPKLPPLLFQQQLNIFGILQYA